MKLPGILRAGVVVATMLAVLGSTAQAGEWTKLRLGNDPSGAPLASVRPDGTMEGFEIDLAAATCARMKVSCEWVRQDWAGIIPALQQGKFDIIFDLLAITPKRKGAVDFAIPITINRQGFMVLKSSPLAAEAPSDAIVSLDDPSASQPVIERFRRELTGKTVCADIATPRIDLLTRYFKEVMVRTYPSLPDCYLDLLAGRIDAEVAHGAFLSKMLRGSDGAKLQKMGPWLTGGLFGSGASVALRKTDPDLKAMLDAAFKEELADGTIRAISLKWFKYDATPPK